MLQLIYALRENKILCSIQVLVNTAYLSVDKLILNGERDGFFINFHLISLNFLK